MNKILNQSNEEIVAEGDPTSMIRMKTRYNITFKKLMDKQWNTWVSGGIYRHVDWRDLYEIIELDNIPIEDRQMLYLSSIHYFSKEVDNVKEQQL